MFLTRINGDDTKISEYGLGPNFAVVTIISNLHVVFLNQN